MSRSPNRLKTSMLIGTTVLISTITLGVFVNLVSEEDLWSWLPRGSFWYLFTALALLVIGAAAVYVQAWLTGGHLGASTASAPETPTSAAPTDPPAPSKNRQIDPARKITTRRLLLGGLSGLGLLLGLQAAPSIWGYATSLFDKGWKGEKTALSGDAPVSSLEFSPDGTTLAVGYQSGEVKLWDPATASVGQTLKASGVAHSLAFSPDGALLATAHGSSIGKGGTVWSLADGTEVASMEDPSIGPVAFSYDGSFLVTGGEYARVWDTESWEAVRDLVGEDYPDWYPAEMVAASPAVPSVLTAGGDGVWNYLWDLNSTEYQEFAPTYLDAHLKYNQGGTVIAAIGAYEVAEAAWYQTVWYRTLATDIGNGDMVTDPGGEPANYGAIDLDEVYCFDFNHDGTLMATSSSEGLKLWKVATGSDGNTSIELSKTLSDAPPSMLAFSRSGNRLAGVGGLDGESPETEVWLITV